MDFNEENFWTLERKVAVLEAKMAFVFAQLRKVGNAESIYDLESVSYYCDEDDETLGESFVDDAEINYYCDWLRELKLHNVSTTFSPQWYAHPAREKHDVPHDAVMFSATTDRNPRLYLHDDRAIATLKQFGFKVDWVSHVDAGLIGEGFYRLTFTIWEDSLNESRERWEAFEAEEGSGQAWFKKHMLEDMDKLATLFN